jgi:integrase
MTMGTDPRGVYHNRESLGTPNVITGMAIIHKIEAGEIIRPVKMEELTIEKAWEKYKEILVTQRRLKPRSIEAIEVVERSMIAFAAREKRKFFKEVDTAFLEKWMVEWKVGDATMVTRRCFLNRLFRAAVDRQWISINPTTPLIKPKPAPSVGTTKPFDLDDELPRIMEAAKHWEDGIINKRKHKSPWSAKPRTAEALILLLKLSGLRISDAFMFDPRELMKTTDGGMYTYLLRQQKKTDRPVTLYFQPHEAEPLLNVEWLSKERPFWDGKSNMHPWTSRFHDNCLDYLERVSGVENIHPHRFRDTFAVEKLSGGLSIRTVSRLLGHKTVVTTLRYYEHYVQADRDETENYFKSPKTQRNERVIPFPMVVNS